MLSIHSLPILLFFFFNDTATTEIYTLSLHDALPICLQMVNGQTNVRGSTGYVQGLNARVLMTVDGIPMNQGDRGGINWDLLAVDEVERLEILKGAGSSLYGSAAFGGVINVTTRDVPAGLHMRLRVNGGIYGDPPHPESHMRSEEHTSELQSRLHLVCRLLLEKKKKKNI